MFEEEEDDDDEEDKSEIFLNLVRVLLLLESVICHVRVRVSPSLIWPINFRSPNRGLNFQVSGIWQI